MNRVEYSDELSRNGELISESEVGWDFDDTLVKYVGPMIAYYNQLHGTDIKYEGFFSTTYEDVWGGTSQITRKFLDGFYTTPNFIYLEPEEGAIEALMALKEAGKNQHIITARFDHLREITTALVDQHFPDVFKSINFLNHHSEDETARKETKAAACKRLGVYRIIEDTDYHAIACADAGIEVIMPIRPWNHNVNHPNIVRLPSLISIADYILTTPRKI